MDDEKLALAGGEMSGNITMNGTETVDGRDLSVDGAKLDAIEAGATADQTAAQVVSTATTNIAALTVQTALAELDDEKLALAGGEMSGNITMNGTETVDGRDLSVDGAKLDAIEAGATADQTAAQVVSTATTNIAALTVQTALAELDDEKLALAGGEMSGNITMNGTETVDGRDLSVDGAKLDAIEAGATADQTAAEVISTATANIAALTVQTALAELDAEKLALAGGTMSGDLTVVGLTVNGEVALNKSISINNTSTSVTINAIAGRFRFQNGTTTKTVLNSFVDPNSIIICTISGTNGIPRTITSCVAGVGQFIVTINGDPVTDQFDINFLVIN